MIEKMKERIDRRHRQIFVFILLIAAIFRIVGIAWGMPFGNLHPDEGIIYVPAYQCALEHKFEVRDYYRPNHVTIKLNTLLYVGIQELYFAPRGLDDFAVNYDEHFPLFIVASRLLIALFSMGIVILAYLMARFWGKNQALSAALLFAVFPSFIEHSHYITPDIPLLFFLMGVLWAALCYLKKPSVKWIFWMSLFTAFAFCEKYPGLYGCAIIAVAVITAHLKKPLVILRNGVLAILFLILGILIVSPVLIVDYREVLKVMASQNHAYHIGADGLNFPQTLWFYLKTTAEHQGLVLTVSAIYGIIKSIRKQTKISIAALTLPAYIIPISMLSLHFERYGLPIYAGALFFGVLGLFCVAEDLAKMTKINAKVSLAANLILFLLPLANLTAGATAFSASFLAPDSRIFLQKEFAKLEVTKDNSLYDCNTPLDPGGFYGVFNEFEEGDPARYKYAGRPTYIVTSSAQRDLFLAADPKAYGWIANFYNALDANYPLIYLYTGETPGYHFLELQNMWCSARSVHRYMKGVARGFEIRVYRYI